MMFDETVDVLVAGTGAAGCAAAIGAVTHGAEKVLVVEKAKRLVGGTTKLAGGGWLWCPNNRFLKQKGVHQSPEEITELLKDLAYPDGNADPLDVELMKAFAHDWPVVVETLQQEKLLVLKEVDVRDGDEDATRIEGLIREKMKSDPEFTSKSGIDESNIKALSRLMPSYCAHHPLDLCPSGKVLSPEGSTSRQLEKAVKKFAPKTEIRMGYQIIDLIRDESSQRVIGAKVLNVQTNETKNIRCIHGVVFGTGGFSHNQDLLKKYFGEENIPYGTCSAKTNTGDLVQICLKENIPVSGMDLAWLKQVVLPFDFSKRLGVFFLNADSFMVVDRTGSRFACEKDFYQQRGTQMFQNKDRKCVFHIYDERSRELFEGPFKSLGGPIPNYGSDDDCVIIGSTVTELTRGIRDKLLQVEPNFFLDQHFESNLEAQLSRFNSYAKSGIDLEFKRGDNVAQYCWHVPRVSDNELPNKTMHPIDTSNLRCLIMGVSTLDTKGGPRINRNGQILNGDATPIPGLYGAGNCVRSSTNKSYPASGVTLSNAVLFGYKAGQHAMVPGTSKV